MDGVNYFHVKVAGLLFVATTRVNVSPSLVLELLQRIARVVKDYLGILNEESLRKNFVLVYELLDEVIVSMLWYLFALLPFIVIFLTLLFPQNKIRPLCLLTIFLNFFSRVPYVTMLIETTKDQIRHGYNRCSL